MEWWDPLVIAVVVSAIVSGAFSAFNLMLARKHYKKLADIESANLIMKLREPWSKDWVKEFLKDAGKNDALRGREVEIDSFLNRMETIAMFMEQKTLKEVHVKELFAEHFKLIRNNRAIGEYYDNARKKNEKYTFTNIAKVLEKMGEWKV